MQVALLPDLPQYLVGGEPQLDGHKRPPHEVVCLSPLLGQMRGAVLSPTRNVQRRRIFLAMGSANGGGSSLSDLPHVRAWAAAVETRDYRRR
jgi:hypothetical protein